MPPTAPELIEAIGGTAATTKLTGVKPCTVARWLEGELPCPDDMLAILARLAAQRTGASFADQLRTLRADGSLTQAAAASAISGVLSVRTLQDWELGRAEPPPWAQELIIDRLAYAIPYP